MKLTLGMAVAWIVFGYDPEKNPNFEAIDHYGILRGKPAEVSDALSRMAIRCREGKLDIFADVSVMRQLINHEEIRELAYDAVYAKGFPDEYELNEKDSLFYVLPKPVKTTDVPVCIAGDSFTASAMDWQSGRIEGLAYSDAIEWPSETERDGLCRYWLQADNCMIDSKALKRCFRNSKKSTGRPPTYDWEEIFIKLSAKIYEEGFPDKQSIIEQHIIDASGNQDMAQSVARKKAQKLWRHRGLFINQ